MTFDVDRRGLLIGGGVAATMATMSGPVLAQQSDAPAAATARAAQGVVPDNEKKINVITLRDLEAQAEKVMAPFGFNYVMGGAGDEWTMRENIAAFNRWVINADFMNGVGSADTSTTLLGAKLSYPVITAPIGNQGSVHAQADLPNIKGTDAAGTLYCASSVSQMSCEDIATATEGPKWFQLYIPRDRGFAREMLQRVKAAGYKALVLTADVNVTSNRERSMRLQGAAVPNLTMGNKPRTPGGKGSAIDMKGDMSWSDVEFCRGEIDLPIVIKSILSPANALQALRTGCSGIWLSNHGGRQLDNTPAAITTLPAVAKAVNGRVPIIIDGGVFRGQDVFRALALGASACAIGRATLYGSALGGAQGVRAVHDHLKNELTMVMRLAGTASVKNIARRFVARAEGAGA